VVQAALFRRPKTLELVDREIPDPRSGEVLIRVSVCGVCGTDVHIFDGEAKSNPPVVLGHEFSGIVEGVGPGVTGLREGDAVAVDPNIFCGYCPYCRRGQVHLCENLRAIGVTVDGAFAEYCKAPASQVYRLPSDVAVEWGAFAEPISCALRGVDRAQIQSGEDVVILGAGNIGLIMLQLVRAVGARQVLVLEPLPERRVLARKYGCSWVGDPREPESLETVKDLTDGGADVVIECVGKPEAVAHTPQLVRAGGRIVIFGMAEKKDTFTLNLQDIFYRELTILGSVLNPFTFARALAALEAGQVNLEHYTIRRFPLPEIQHALAEHRRGKYLKVLVVPGKEIKNR